MTTYTSVQRPRRPCRSGQWADPVPFHGAEEAWLWTTAALAARHNGARSGSSALPRPCEPDDVVNCLDRLYQRGRLSVAHVRVLLTWGQRQAVPSSRHPAEQADATLWHEALSRLEWPLRMKGIISDLTS